MSGMDTHMQNIGKQVREARKNQGMSAATLATKAGIAANTVSAIENGRSVRPGNLRAVLDALGIEPLAERQARIGYPPDVELVRDMVGMYLMALPESERADVAFGITRYLAGRNASSERTTGA